MIKYFEMFHDFSENQNGVRYIFVPLIRVLNLKTGLGETFKLVFEEVKNFEIFHDFSGN